MRYLLLILATSGVLASTSWAEDPKPTTAYTLTAGLTVVNASTDSQTLNVLGSIDHIRPKVDVIHLDGGYFFQRQTTTLSNQYNIASNFAFANGRYDKNVTDKLAVYGSLGYRVDNPNNLKLRQLYGLGMAYQVHQGKVWSWNLSAGGAYLIENYVNGAQSAYKPSAAFGSQYNRSIGSKMDISNTLTFVPAFSNSADFVATSVLSLGYQISKPLKFTINNVVDYQNSPPPGTLKKNSQWFIGLTFTGKS